MIEVRVGDLGRPVVDEAEVAGATDYTWSVTHMDVVDVASDPDGSNATFLFLRETTPDEDLFVEVEAIGVGWLRSTEPIRVVPGAGDEEIDIPMSRAAYDAVYGAG